MTSFHLFSLYQKLYILLLTMSGWGSNSGSLFGNSDTSTSSNNSKDETKSNFGTSLFGGNSKEGDVSGSTNFASFGPGFGTTNNGNKTFPPPAPFFKSVVPVTTDQWPRLCQRSSPVRGGPSQARG